MKDFDIWTLVPVRLVIPRVYLCRLFDKGNRVVGFHYKACVTSI